jgi:hypothetical protein
MLNAVNRFWFWQEFVSYFAAAAAAQEMEKQLSISCIVSAILAFW